VIAVPARPRRRGPDPLRLVARGAGRVGPWVRPALVVALAAVLRLAALGRQPLDPFYDASVRSMGGGGHAFLVGAFDPSARLAIDKPPVDLWLQVASTRVFGFTPFALLLPVALGGILTVVLLYDLLRTLLGPRVALAGAAALAVLPIAVITARSDTMDSVMAALLVGALAVAARGLRRGRLLAIVGAGALVGLAFEVKLFEALLGVVPLAVLWWFGAAGSRRRRALGLAGAAGAAAAVGVAWLVVLTLAVPAHDRPWAFGSTNGSAWNATFVYDGLDRLTGNGPDIPAQPRDARAALRAPGPPGPLRLLSPRVHLGARIGFAVAAALVALAGAAALRRLPRDRVGAAGLAALAAWLAVGLVLFSAQPGLRPRYLEAVDPAVAACLAAGLMLAAGLGRAVAPDGRLRAGRPVPRWLAIGALAAVLAFGLAVSVSAVAGHVQDSGAPGGLPRARLAALSAYLRGHQHGARYEVASVAVAKAGPVIARDGRPVLMLTGTAGHPLVSNAALARLVATGAVHTAIVGDRCLRGAPRAIGCSAPARWIRAHGVDVSRAAGQPHRGFVYALGQRCISLRNADRKRHVRAVELNGLSEASPGQPCSASSTRSWATTRPSAHAHRSSRTLGAGRLRLGGFGQLSRPRHSSTYGPTAPAPSSLRPL
jgi:4-amino-4-deoxy-L-arabinose transferase-like glycosyltransferase